MNGLRSLLVSFAVLFALLFCFGTSAQAVAVEEEVDLKGPEAFPTTTCTGAVVGRATIRHKDLSLAEQITGEIFDKDKSNTDLTVTVRFRNGPPDTIFIVSWRALSIAGNCDTVVAGTFIGTITTDAQGRARARYPLPGNPFPPNGVKLNVCIPTGPTFNCIAGDDVYTALFTEVFQ